MGRKRNLLITLVLDESGSMMLVRDRVISGFNEYVESLRRDHQSKIELAVVSFNSWKPYTPPEWRPIMMVPPLTAETYAPDGVTPLYDAIVRAADDTVRRQQSYRGINPLPSILFVIQTDGQENASHTYRLADVHDCISRLKALSAAVLFMGADQNAFVAAGAMGVDRGNTWSYNNTARDTDQLWRNLYRGTQSYAGGQSMSNNVVADSFNGSDDFDAERTPPFVTGTHQN